MLLLLIGCGCGWMRWGSVELSPLFYVVFSSIWCLLLQAPWSYIALSVKRGRRRSCWRRQGFPGFANTARATLARWHRQGENTLAVALANPPGRTTMVRPGGRGLQAGPTGLAHCRAGGWLAPRPERPWLHQVRCDQWRRVAAGMSGLAC